MPRRRGCDPVRRSRDGDASRATPMPWPRGSEAAGASAGPVSGCQDATNELEIASPHTRVRSKGAVGSASAPAALARSRRSRVYYARCIRRSATCQRDRIRRPHHHRLPGCEARVRRPGPGGARCRTGEAALDHLFDDTKPGMHAETEMRSEADRV